MRKLIIISLLALILTTGCVQVTSKLPGLPKKAEPGLIATTQSVLVDIKGPKADETIQERYDLAPAVEVTDSGDADAEGVVCISGLDERDFKGFLGCECQDFSIYASDEDGEVTQLIEFGPYPIDADSEKESLMTATTRYKYETTGTAKACIKKDLYSRTGCQTSIGGREMNLLTRSTSGAVKITGITEKIIAEEEDSVTLVFDIDMEKASKGSLYDPDRAGYPSCRTEEQETGKISAKINGLPQANADCSETELDEDGEGTITCEARGIRLFDRAGRFLFSGDSYEPEIEVKLKYGYEQISSVKFSIAP